MRNALYYLWFLVAGILPLAGQTESGIEKSGKSARSAWFACISLPTGIENPVKLMSGKELIELELSDYVTSAPVKIPSDGVIRIVREQREPANPEKVKYLVLAEARIAENVRQALIILAPLPKPQGDLIFLTKVQDLAQFKGGDRLFINLSDAHVRVKIGDIQVSIAAGQSNIYPAPVLNKPSNASILYQFYDPEEKAWKLLSASTVIIHPTRREICIFNSGSRIGNIKKHTILFPVQMESNGVVEGASTD